MGAINQESRNSDDIERYRSKVMAAQKLSNGSGRHLIVFAKHGEAPIQPFGLANWE